MGCFPDRFHGSRFQPGIPAGIFPAENGNRENGRKNTPTVPVPVPVRFPVLFSRFSIFSRPIFNPSHTRLVRSFLDVDGVGSGLRSLPLLLSPGGKASWAICFTQWAKGKGARLGLIWEAQSLLVSKWMGWDFSHGTLPSTKECNSQFL